MNMDYGGENQWITNSPYNLGLEKAKIRDLSGAARCLKKSLHFSKFQTNARNLLGLIYCENGEVADTLVQWIISLNLQPEGNPADHYLDEIQRKPGQLERESQNVKAFNQVLWHAQNGSDNLAILQLARVVELNPHFMKVHLLLVLLYVSREDYSKMGRSLYKIPQIDKSNQKALYYTFIVKQNTGRADAEKRKMVKAFLHRQMEDDDVIIPNSYKESTGLSTIPHIIIGLFLRVAAFFALILPARTKALNSEENQEIIVYSQKLGNANQQYGMLKSEYDKLDAQAKEVQSRLDELTNGNTSVIAQYQGFIWILQNYRTGDMVMAAKSFVEASFDLIEDENIWAIVESIRQDVTANIYQTLVERGLTLWNTDKKTGTMDYFQASLTIRPDNPEALFYIGRPYQDAGDMDNANTMFDKVVNELPSSDYVDRVRNARGYQHSRILQKISFICLLQHLFLLLYRIRKEYESTDHAMFTYEAREQALVIHLPKELDHHNCKNLKSDTDLLLDEDYINRIVFDFTHTSFMDSPGIGVLLSRYKQMAANRGKVAYCGAGAQVRRILEMGGMNRLMQGYNDRKSTLKG